MLVDAAKHGDVEIPVFCYEPKLGEPVGACRMCLVEIEGIPKLQTACSTPVRDGMVVYTQTDRVKEAQNAVVEFLLVNHPLDCPVCDKGGECPLQDIAMGWGPGKSRFTDPKRHFQKPLPLSPLVRIDRERCILCYRCVRFSQEVAEDEQLQLLERGAASYVGTFDDRPYIAPFHGNIIELCPVGRAHLRGLPLPRPALGHRGGGLGLHALPEPVQRAASPSATRRVQRVLARDNPEVDDGWLCDKGRFGFQMIASPERITEPMVRARAAPCEPVELGRGARRRRRRACAAARPGARRSSGGGTSNEEGYLAQRIVRGALGSPNVDSRAAGAADRGLLAELSRPELGARLSRHRLRPSRSWCIGADPLHEMPILDLRIRKAIRRSGARLAVATERPTPLDGGAEETARYAPGDAAALPPRARRPTSALRRRPAPSAYAEPASEVAGALRPGADRDRLGRAPRPRARRRRGPRRAGRAAPSALQAGEDGAGLLEVPDAANARGLREAGCLPDAGPGLRPRPTAGSDAAGIRDALAAGELGRGILLNANPVRDYPDGPGWARGAERGRLRRLRSRCSRTTRPSTPTCPPGRVARREGGHRHPSRRPPPADAPLRPPPGRRPPRLAGPRRARRPPRRRDRHRLGHRGARRARCRRSPSTRASRPTRSAARGIRWQERERCGDFPNGGGGWLHGAASAQGSSRLAEAAMQRMRELAPADIAPLLATGTLTPRHLPRPLGRGSHRAQPGAAVPDAEADGGDRAVGRGEPGAESGRRGRREVERDSRAGAGRDPRADAARERPS